MITGFERSRIGSVTVLSQSRSPEGLEFGPRRKSFDIEASLSRNWHGDSLFVTAWFNAMSLLFPLGEKFFIDSVVHYEHEIDDPKLKVEVRAFRAQEATHRVQHQRYNELLCRLRDYDLARFERVERERMDWAYRELSPRRRLAGTVANEHITAIMAHEMLTNRMVMAGADPAIAALWEWHGIEETEHKAVAFDVFTTVGGTVRERRVAMFMNTIFFFKDTMRNVCIMLQKEGKLWSLSEWWAGMKYLFIRPGILRRVAGPWCRFFRRDFHPWQIDDRDLIARWESQQQSASTANP